MRPPVRLAKNFKHFFGQSRTIFPNKNLSLQKRIIVCASKHSHPDIKTKPYKMKDVHVVIIAGGEGKRLWPISNQDTPKQFVDLFGCGRTLIQLTVDRFKGICNEKNIWVVTSEEFENLVVDQIPGLRKDHILLEPMRKNTMPAIAYFTWKIKAVAPEATVVVVNGDQMVTNYDYYAHMINEAIDFVQANDALVVVGVKPDREEVGHGYIETYPAEEGATLCKMKKYLGRPTDEVAGEFVKIPNCYWNTSIFVCKVKTLEDSYRKHAPEVADAFDTLEPSLFSPREQYMLNEVLYNIPEAISYERAIMKDADNVYVYPAEMGWSDLSTWSDMLPFLSMARYSNLKVGKNIKAFNCNNCIIQAPNAKAVVVDGLDGYVVAEKDGALLICRLDNEKQIRQWAEQNNDTELLPHK